MSLVARLRLGVGIILCLLHTAPMAGPLPGEALFAVACEACHSLESEPDHRIGPPLGGLNDRKAAAVSGFAYSPALQNSDWRWTLPTLLAWLTDPDAAIPNNAMNYVNALSAEETQRLAEWLLAQQSD
ncbi:MAG: hypothetical protein EBY45_00795 [Gammaproteobacteria bacterium]|nr:hypothetical protein [Gammaproteobacteria bacterium]